MAAFEKEVFDATKETDPALIEKQQENYRRRAEKIQRQFGGQQQAGTPKLGIGTRFGAQDAMTQAKIDDANRRKQATQNAFELGSQIDARKTGIAAQIDAAVRRRQQDQQKYADTQGQQDREHSLAMQELKQQGKEGVRKINFTAYTNDAQRKDAMASLFNQGMLHQQMSDAIADGALKQADIDAFFNMQQAKLRNDFEAAMKMGKLDFEKWMTNITNETNNWAQILEGATTGAKVGLKYKYDYKKKEPTYYNTGGTRSYNKTPAEETEIQLDPTSISYKQPTYYNTGGTRQPEPNYQYPIETEYPLDDYSLYGY